jgi:heptosyltransferase-2
MNFLIIRLSSLGDIILTQPVVAELQDRYPGCGITYVCKPEYVALVRMMDPAIKILPFGETMSFFAQLRKDRYDAVLDLHGKLASTLILLGTKAKKRFRYDKQRSLRQAIVAHRSDQSINSTVQLYYSALDRLTGIAPDSFKPPQLRLPDISLTPERMPKGIPGKRLIGIFPGAAHLTKMYPEQQWREFFQIADADWSFVLLGSLKESRIADRLMTALPDRIENRCGSYSFEELALVMSQCDLIISADSGPMHLAAALNLPQIAIFGSTHPRLGFAPQNPKAIVLCADLPCQPCTLHGQDYCPLGHFECMKKISPGMLKDKVVKVLGV